MIEKGRHLGINKTERFCPFRTDIVESEEYFLLHCTTFSPLRATLIFEIVVKIPFAEQMYDHKKFITLLINENIVDQVGNYIQKALHCRRFLLSKHKSSIHHRKIESLKHAKFNTLHFTILSYCITYCIDIFHFFFGIT